MAFKQVQTGNTLDIKTEVGKSYVGKYEGSKPVHTPLGETVIWKFKDNDGVAFAVWGFTSLNFQMESVQIGALCRITYLGKGKEKNKFGKFPHKAKVEVNTDDIAPEEEVPF